MAFHVVAIVFIYFLAGRALSYDTTDLEIFDLVEEVGQQTFYDFLQISQVSASQLLLTGVFGKFLWFFTTC